MHDGPQGRVVAGILLLDKLIEQLRGKPLQPLGALRDAEAVVEVVEDVVGAAGEPVQRVYRGALLGCQQPGGEEERPAVLGVEQPAVLVGVAQGRIAHTGGIEFGADHVWPAADLRP